MTTTSTPVPLALATDLLTGTEWNAARVRELFALTSQLRRAGASIPSNFVEGFRRRTTPDKLRSCNTAQASADECLYQLILAHDLQYAKTAALQIELDEVFRLLQGYINGLVRGGS